MLVFDGLRYAWRRFGARLHGHEHVEPLEMSSYGPKTAFGVGMIHGIVFIAYCLTTVLLSVDQRWPLSRLALGLLAAIPPFVTVPFERYAERAGLLGDASRLRSEDPRGLLEKPTAWLLRRPAQGALVGLVAVAGLTGIALVVGPPA